MIYCGGFFISVCIVGTGICFFWKIFFQYVFFKIKHLLPWWQWPQEFVNQWQQTIRQASSTDWRSQVVIQQNGRKIKRTCPFAPYGKRVEYALIKKRKK